MNFFALAREECLEMNIKDNENKKQQQHDSNNHLRLFVLTCVVT